MWSDSWVDGEFEPLDEPSLGNHFSVLTSERHFHLQNEHVLMNRKLKTGRSSTQTRREEGATAART